MVAIPVARDQLIPMLVAGRGRHRRRAAHDHAGAPEGRWTSPFPVATGVREVLVTGPDAPPVASLDGPLGQGGVHPGLEQLRRAHRERSTSASRTRASRRLTITPAPEVLEDGDILEMVSAGLVPATVVDEVTADLYTQVFPNLKKHSDIASPPGDIAWAFRKGSPKLAAAVNAFVKTHKAGHARRQRAHQQVHEDHEVGEERAQRRGPEALRVDDRASSRSTADQYDLDYLLMAAQGYQESQLDQSKRSHVGAIGVMQVMPATARDKAVNIPDIQKLENNIHAGVKYNRWMMDNFYKEPGLDRLNRGLFAFASYNAGPGRVASLRKEAKAQGLDPNKWFNNVELVAAKRIGRETVTYVSNIFKYYLAYQMMVQGEQARREAKAAAAKR